MKRSSARSGSGEPTARGSLTAGGLAVALLRLGLPAWFLGYAAYSTWVLAIRPELVFVDARIYLVAADALVSGGNPWATPYQGAVFAGPPPSLLPFIPLLPLGDLAPAAAFAICLASAVAAVRVLALPWIWVLWPPLYVGVLAANLDAALPALLASRLAMLGAFAVIAKVYAAVPLTGARRWTDLAIAGLLILVTAPFLAWDQFIADIPQILANLAAQSGGGGTSAWPSPVLVAIAVIALLSLRSADAWLLAVPVLWPNTQFHYAALALPLAARSAVIAVGLSLPFAGMPAITAVVYAVMRRAPQLASRLPRLAGGTVVPPRQRVATRR